MNHIVSQLSQDPRLAPIIEKVGMPRIRQESDYYKALVESIVSQQLSVKAADAIFAKFLSLFEANSKSFPDPASIIAMNPDRLREVGLSFRKIEYIKDLAVHIERGDIVFSTLEQLDDNGVIEVLTRVRGIGTWTVHMFLIFSMGRQDVLPIGDLGIKKGFQKVYELPSLPTEEEMARLSQKWRPYRSIGSWYLWQSLGL